MFSLPPTRYPPQCCSGHVPLLSPAASAFDVPAPLWNPVQTHSLYRVSKVLQSFSAPAGLKGWVLNMSGSLCADCLFLCVMQLLVFDGHHPINTAADWWTLQQLSVVPWSMDTYCTHRYKWCKNTCTVFVVGVEAFHRLWESAHTDPRIFWSFFPTLFLLPLFKFLLNRLCNNYNFTCFISGSN